MSHTATSRSSALRAKTKSEDVHAIASTAQTIMREYLEARGYSVIEHKDAEEEESFLVRFRHKQKHPREEARLHVLEATGREHAEDAEMPPYIAAGFAPGRKLLVYVLDGAQHPKDKCVMEVLRAIASDTLCQQADGFVLITRFLPVPGSNISFRGTIRAKSRIAEETGLTQGVVDFELFSMASLQRSVLRHVAVPPQRIVSRDHIKVRRFLRRFPDKVPPIIKETDVVARALGAVSGNYILESGSIVCLVRSELETSAYTKDKCVKRANQTSHL